MIAAALASGAALLAVGPVTIGSAEPTADPIALTPEPSPQTVAA